MAIRVPINLASEPFRRDRPLVVGSAALAILLTLLLVYQVFTIVSERRQAADIRVALARETAQLQRVSAQQAKLNATLHRPENSEVLERSLFLNTLIERKGISWTKIFSDLGKTMPANVRLMTIRPFVNKDNKVTLDMTIGAMTPVGVIDFLKALESSPLFEGVSAPTYLAPSQAEPLYRARLTVNYAQKL
ncbi:MAG TPA: hypothetical protein VFW44_09030 [Bryobacteraceae bacterium]|nr:hypothetical protein [Bryobacteraceae bacterium]